MSKMTCCVCGKPIGGYGKTGKCRSCAQKATWTEAKRQAASERLQALWADGVFDSEGHRLARSQNRKDAWARGDYSDAHTPETNRLRAEGMKAAWTRGDFDGDGYLQKLSEGQRAAWQDKKRHDKRSAAIKEAHQTPDMRRKHSEAAHQRWQNEEYRQCHTGENNHAWRGGLSLEPYGPDWTETLREQIRERDGRVCQLCGIHESERDEKLNVHHIDYSKTNHAPSNLIALCRSCHTKTGYSRANWQMFFAGMMEQREKPDETDDSAG